MRRNLLFLLIIILSIITRLLFFGKIPPLVNDSSVTWRLLSSLLSIGNTLFIYYVSYKIFRKTKVALLSSFVFTFSPWMIEQGRIYSQSNIALFFFLITILISRKLKDLFPKIILSLSYLITLYIVYPQFFHILSNISSIGFSNFINNIFKILSFDFLFFRNNSFWWGGVRDAGIFLPLFVPFFILGLWEIPEVIRKNLYIAFWFFLSLVVASSNPFFPEGRYYFMIIPVLSLIIALGLKWTVCQLNRNQKYILSAILVLLFIYNFIDFWHTYNVHQLQRISGNIEKINEKY